MPFFTPLCGFSWLLLPLGTSCLPLRAYLTYLFFKKNSHLKTHVFSCIYDAKLFCPSPLWAMKNACFNLPSMLCCSFFLSVIYATYCALSCIIQHKVARWVSAMHALQWRLFTRLLNPKLQKKPTWKKERAFENIPKQVSSYYVGLTLWEHLLISISCF